VTGQNEEWWKPGIYFRAEPITAAFPGQFTRFRYRSHQAGGFNPAGVARAWQCSPTVIVDPLLANGEQAAATMLVGTSDARCQTTGTNSAGASPPIVTGKLGFVRPQLSAT
jgi:hypothetical protein